MFSAERLKILQVVLYLFELFGNFKKELIVSVAAREIVNYINGRWTRPSEARPLTVFNPATGRPITSVLLSSAADVDEAVKSAKRAFTEWRATALSRRIELLSRLRDLVASHKEELALSITLEHGKILGDSRGEMTRALENMTQALNIGLMQSGYLANIAGGISEYSRRVPMGVFCGITPFNFPVMIPFWFMPYALLAGNTYVLKPSEQTPITITRIFELIHEAGFPSGAVNLVHGDAVAAQSLLEHPDIVGASSVSSTPVMKMIWEKATRLGKRVQCQGGAKNFIVVTADVSRIKVVPHILDSVFGNSGQRCLAGSNVVLVGPRNFYRKMIADLRDAARQMKVGDGAASGAQMGPVISAAARDRILSYINRGIREGARLTLDGREVNPLGEPGGYWLGPTIFTEVRPEMSIACEEIFGPVMTVLCAETIDEAIAMIQGSGYGNAAMIFTENGKTAQRFREDDFAVGNVGINIGLPAPIPPFPFGGMKDSFRGDLHGQGRDAIQFFTQEKVIIERWL